MINGIPNHLYRTYGAWKMMVRRCTSKNLKAYHLYGGRGISVCKRWLKFENFYADMGEPEPGLTIDRIDNNKGYSPSNCRWADRKTQGRNRRDVKMFLFKGKKRSVPEISEITGIRYAALWHRIKHWGFDMALIVPHHGKSRMYK